MPVLPKTLKSHRQDHDDDCGRACAQMVIGYVLHGGGGVAPALVQQDTLKSREQNKLAGWATDPSELGTLVNDEIGALTATRWKMVRYRSFLKTLPGSLPDPFGPITLVGHASATRALLKDVKVTIDHGSPAVMATGNTDHWIVITGYDVDEFGEMFALYIADPNRVTPIGSTFAHTHVDACDTSETIYLTKTLPIDYFIVNAPPFDLYAVGIVTHAAPSEDEIREAMVRASQLTIFPDQWRIPFPFPDLRLLPPLSPWFLSREASLRVAAHRWLPELRVVITRLNHATRAEVVRELDPATARVRYVRFQQDERPPFVLVGAPVGQDAAVLLVLNQAAEIYLIDLNAPRAVVDAMAAPDLFAAEDLFCVSRFGQLQPFRRRLDDGRVVFERLGDGFRWPRSERTL
jgi:hypothetical protein